MSKPFWISRLEFRISIAPLAGSPLLLLSSLHNRPKPNHNHPEPTLRRSQSTSNGPRHKNLQGGTTVSSIVVLGILYLRNEGGTIGTKKNMAYKSNEKWNACLNPHSTLLTVVLARRPVPQQTVSVSKIINNPAMISKDRSAERRKTANVLTIIPKNASNTLLGADGR